MTPMTKKLKVLHLVAGELNGGAARGAYWLHQAQRAAGIDSVLMTSSRSDLGDSSVISLAKSSWQKLKFMLLPRLGGLLKGLYKNRKNIIFNTGFEGVDFTKHPAYVAADIVHLHWINGLVSMQTLSKIDKPIVWTMRDMWPLTGGCHYAMDCEQYRTGCGKCPQLGSQFKHDLSRLVVSNKRRSLNKRMRLIGISEWLSSCARDSFVFSGFKIDTIANNIDTNQFFPVNRINAREILGLPSNKKIILVGAASITDFYKGYDLFIESTKSLDSSDIHIVIFGNTNTQALELERLGAQHTSLGYLADTISLRLAYSAADVFVAPSRMEAFGKTLVESMACGTPVVCFDATGPKDIVTHQMTGYKAKPFDPADLAAGIRWVVEQPQDEFDRLCRQARQRAADVFGSHVAADQYKKLYLELLDESENRGQLDSAFRISGAAS